MSASSEETNELSLKFLFVNQDGVNVVLKFPKTTKISTVKQSLIENWPEKIELPENLKSIRLICMGRGMLQDKETIASSKIPSFPTYPTPVNVSVARLPSTISVVKNIKSPSENNTSVAPKSPTQAEENMTQISSSASVPATLRNPDAGCACIIL